MKMLHALAAVGALATVTWGGVTWGLPVLGLDVLGRHAERDAPVLGLRKIFSAGFEDPVFIVADDTGQRAWLKGRDVDGQTWDGLDHVFEMVAPRSFDHLVTTEFSDEHVRSGSRSLFLRQNVEEGGTQNRLQFFSNDGEFSSEIFTRRHYFVPGRNLDYLPGQDDAVSIAGTREVRGGSAPPGADNADFSMPLYIVRRGDQLVFAQAIIDYSAGPNWSDWTRPPSGLLAYGNETPVPIDRWFELDIYVKRDPVHGEIRVWLDGEPIFELEDVRTKNDTDAWFTKLADVDSEPAPFELWVDDVEIWTR
ncbi:hypothetical protein [Aliihoeflea sp. PC F10.4]